MNGNSISSYPKNFGCLVASAKIRDVFRLKNDFYQPFEKDCAYLGQNG